MSSPKFTLTPTPIAVTVLAVAARDFSAVKSVSCAGLSGGSDTALPIFVVKPRCYRHPNGVVSGRAGGGAPLVNFAGRWRASAISTRAFLRHFHPPVFGPRLAGFSSPS